MLIPSIPPEQKHSSPYRWVLLALATLTPMLTFTMPLMALPVLFDEISKELHFSLFQIGVIWAIDSLTGIFIGLAAGSLGDRRGRAA